MVFKDQDDCSKRLVCELNAMRSDGKVLSEHEEVLADAFGNSGELDVGKDSLEFDIAAVLGREVTLPGLILNFCTSDDCLGWCQEVRVELQEVRDSGQRDAQ